MTTFSYEILAGVCVQALTGAVNEWTSILTSPQSAFSACHAHEDPSRYKMAADSDICRCILRHSDVNSTACYRTYFEANAAQYARHCAQRHGVVLRWRTDTFFRESTCTHESCVCWRLRR